MQTARERVRICERISRNIGMRPLMRPPAMPTTGRLRSCNDASHFASRALHISLLRSTAVHDTVRAQTTPRSRRLRHSHPCRGRHGASRWLTKVRLLGAGHCTAWCLACDIAGASGGITPVSTPYDRREGSQAQRAAAKRRVTLFRGAPLCCPLRAIARACMRPGGFCAMRTATPAHAPHATPAHAPHILAHIFSSPAHASTRQHMPNICARLAWLLFSVTRIGCFPSGGARPDGGTTGGLPARRRAGDRGVFVRAGVGRHQGGGGGTRGARL